MIKGMHFDCLEDLLDEIIDCRDINVLADNNTIKGLIELLIKADYVLETLDFNCVMDKHLLIVGEDGAIDVIPFEDEDGCKWTFDEDDVVYVIDDLTDEVQEDGKYIVFSIGEEDTEISESDDGHFISMTDTNTDKYGNMSMFSRSFYSKDKYLVDLMVSIWRG